MKYASNSCFYMEGLPGPHTTPDLEDQRTFRHTVGFNRLRRCRLWDILICIGFSFHLVCTIQWMFPVSIHIDSSMGRFSQEVFTNQGFLSKLQQLSTFIHYVLTKFCNNWCVCHTGMGIWVLR